MSRAAAVECLLFVSGEPLTPADLARALECGAEDAEAAVAELRDALDAAGRGLQVVAIAGGFQLATRPAHSETIGRLLARSANRLSRAALETLAIVAYRQPITQPELEAVRGVGCGSVLKTLVDRRLLADVGRKQALGRPILYATTQEFLHYFALSDLADLPPIDDLPTPLPRVGSAAVDDPAQRDPTPDEAGPGADQGAAQSGIFAGDLAASDEAHRDEAVPGAASAGDYGDAAVVGLAGAGRSGSAAEPEPGDAVPDAATPDAAGPPDDAGNADDGRRAGMDPD